MQVKAYGSQPGDCYIGGSPGAHGDSTGEPHQALPSLSAEGNSYLSCPANCVYQSPAEVSRACLAPWCHICVMRLSAESSFPCSLIAAEGASACGPEPDHQLPEGQRHLLCGTPPEQSFPGWKESLPNQCRMSSCFVEHWSVLHQLACKHLT